MNLYVSTCMKQNNYYLANTIHLIDSNDRIRVINNVIYHQKYLTIKVFIRDILPSLLPFLHHLVRVFTHL